MNKFLSLILFITIHFVSYGQNWQYSGNVNNATREKGGTMFGQTLGWPCYTSFPSWPYSFSDSGRVIFVNGLPFYKMGADWVQFASASGSGITALTLGRGLLGTSNPITTTGTAYVDSSLYATIRWTDSVFAHYLTISSANSLFALKMNYTDTAGMLSAYMRKGDSSANGGYMPWYYANANFLTVETDPIATAKTFTATNGYGITGLSGTGQTIGSNPSITPGTDTTKLSTKAYRQKGIDSIALNFYPNTNPNGYTSNTGTVTSIVAGTGLSGGTITTTGTISLPSVGTANTYAYPSSVTTDAEGRVTSITAGSASTGTVTSVSGGTNITITGTATITPTVNISGTIAVANGGTGTTAQTSVNTTPITLGSNNTITAAPSGAAGGSLGGSYPNPTIASSVSLPGSPTTTTQSANDNSTKVSTTAYVDQYVPTYSTTTTTTTLTPTSAIADRRTPVYNTITAQGSALSIANPSGTFVDMQIIEIRLYDNGTSRAITYGSNYNAGNGTLPANTTTGKCIYEEYQYNAQSTKYDCIAGCGATAW